jgi:hypothetical protein
MRQSSLTSDSNRDASLFFSFAHVDIRICGCGEDSEGALRANLARAAARIRAAEGPSSNDDAVNQLSVLAFSPCNPQHGELATEGMHREDSYTSERRCLPV